MGIKFDVFNFISGIIKIGITSILSAQTTIEPSLASFIGDSATELLSSLSFEKKKTIKDSIEKLPEQIMPVIADFTMPDECRKNLAYRLFTLERLKACAESKNILGTFKSLIITICMECPDCDIETLQINEIAGAILNKVKSLFLEDKNLSDIVNLFIDRATYDIALESNRKLDFIIEKLILSDNTKKQGNKTCTSLKQKVSWITTFPYIPATKHHVARENEEEMVQNILSDSTKIAISGIVGGIGKTELLQLVCKRVLDTCQYRYVGWIYYSGDIKSDILNSIDSQFVYNNDPIKNILTLDFQYGKDLILFIDNINDNNDEYINVLNRLTCKVVVTTRKQTFFDFNMTYLNLLTEEIATRIFLTYNDQINRKADRYIKQIIEICGCHPLAIELVGKYAKKRKLTNETLLSELLENGYNLNGLVDSNWNGNKNELITTQLSKLYKLSNLSLNKHIVYILKCFALIPSKPITKLFVDSIVDGKNADYVSFDILADAGWISSGQSGWYMHDIVKSVVKRELVIKIDDCTDFLENLCKYSTNLIDYKVMINSLALLVGVAEFFFDVEVNYVLIKIYNDIGYVYQEITDHQNAKKWFERAVVAFNYVDQNEELILLKGLVSNNMGMALQSEFTQKKYKNENISNKDIQLAISWYDKSLEYYEILLREHVYDTIDVERRKLVAENNKATCLYQGGQQEEAISLLNEIIHKKLQIINQFLTILLKYYSRLLNDKHYSKVPSIVDGHKSLEVLASIIQKAYKSNDEIDIDQSFNDDTSLSDVLLRLDDYKFALDNELIPSLIRSCDVYADCQCDYIMSLTNPEEIDYRLSLASSRIHFALDICEMIEKITVFEGAVWGTLSRLHFAWELKFANVSSKDAAIKEQLHGIQILEHVFKEANDNQSKEPLLRAYNNMYVYTKEEEWKKKAEQITPLQV